MTKRTLAAFAVLILAALAIPATGGSQTENTFCEFEDPEVTCADVVVQKMDTNPCTGDLIDLTGTIHVAVFQDENQARIHTNWQDVRGVALSGTIYQANEATRMYQVARPSGSFTTVFQDQRELVSQGSGDNFILREYVEITFYPDPTKPPTIKEHGETKCTG
jgi:hypothetical protein